MIVHTLKMCIRDTGPEQNLVLFNPVHHRDAFAIRADPDQADLLRAAWSVSTLFAFGNMIRYDPTLVYLTSNFLVQSLLI